MDHRTADTIPLAEFKSRISAILNEMNEPGAAYLLTQNGRAGAVVVPAAVWDSLHARIEILEDLARAAADIAGGDTMTSDDIREHFRNRYSTVTGHRPLV